MSFICYNGLFLPADQPVILANNRGYKWGDGLFETLKIYKGKILLQAYHYDRLLISTKLLQMKINFTLNDLVDNILGLCQRNDCLNLARVRLAIYREADNVVGYTIEATKLNEQVMQWNEQGLTIDTYPYVRKSCDVLSNLKTANFLPYVMADLYAKENALDEVLVLNSYNHICDASKANIFCIKGKAIFTPALDQGCINGVMRRFILEEAKKKGWIVKQIELTEAFLLASDECFLTNAIQGIRWVHNYRDRLYSCSTTRHLFHTVYSTNSY